jgi:hypothetical protein
MKALSKNTRVLRDLAGEMPAISLGAIANFPDYDEV